MINTSCLVSLLYRSLGLGMNLMPIKMAQVRLALFTSLIFSQCFSIANCQEQAPKNPVYVRDVTLPAVTQDELVSLELPMEIFQRTSDLDHKVRLHSSTGQPVHFLIRPRSEQRIEEKKVNQTVKSLTVEDVSGDRLIYNIVLAPNSKPIDSLTFKTQNLDFEQRVQVFAVGEDGTETEILSDGLIFDRSRFLDYQNLTVNFESNPSLKFRIEFGDTTVEQKSVLESFTHRVTEGGSQESTVRSGVIILPFRVEEIVAGHTEKIVQKTQQVVVEQPIQNFTKTRESDATVYEFKSDGRPINQITFLTEDRIFKRPVSLEVMSQTPKPKEILQQNSSIYRFQFRDQIEESVSIKFDPLIPGSFKIHIKEDESSPVAVTGFDLGGPGFDLSFIASPNETYQLRYGDNLPGLRNTEATPFLNRIESQESPIFGQLGTEKTVEMASLPVPPIMIDDLIKNPWIFGSVILVLVLTLGAVLVKTMKQLNLQKPEDA